MATEEDAVIFRPVDVNETDRPDTVLPALTLEDVPMPQSRSWEDDRAEELLNA